MTVVLIVAGVLAGLVLLGMWCGHVLRRDIEELRRWSGDDK